MDWHDEMFNKFFTKTEQVNVLKVKTAKTQLEVNVGTDGSISMTWAGGTLTIPMTARDTFLTMVEKAVRMSKEAVPNAKEAKAGSPGDPL